MRRLLIPIRRAQTAPTLLEMAEALILSEGGAGDVLGVVEMGVEPSVNQNVVMARRYRALLQRITDLEQQARAGFGVQVRVAANLAQGIREAVIENQSNMIVVDWNGRENRRVLDPNLEDLVGDPPADLLLVKPGKENPPGEGVLAAIRGGLASDLILRIAQQMALARKTHLTILHVQNSPEEADSEAEETWLQLRKQLKSLKEDIDLRIVELEAIDPQRAILEHGQEHSIVVLGAHTEAIRSPTLVGSRLAGTVRRLPGVVILVKTPLPSFLTPPEEPSSPFEMPLVVSPPDVAAVVDRWFAEKTYNAEEFRNVNRLVQLKQSQGLTISLGLPTLNEAPTIGRVIGTLKWALMEKVPLLDEIVVIDSGSTDETALIAQAMGVPVIQHRAILSEMGSFSGKGEALWKSLHRLQGDIVAWCDTDVSNIHPRFIYGIVGPLLTDRRISYVKGFYRRPLNFGGKLETSGGGRVTELTARPLFNLFYPQLSGLLQPLAGEYAGRRELLEKLPFFTGYGVETGHLIDILEGFGLNHLAQSDLGSRVHRNQSLFNLSQMAFAIMQVAVKRLGDRYHVRLIEEVNRSMKLIHHAENRFFLELKEIGDWERPPLLTIPEYLQGRLKASKWWARGQARTGKESEQQFPLLSLEA